MKRRRSALPAIGMLGATLGCVGLGAVALSGFNPAPGDLAAGSTSPTADLVLALGSALLLILDFVHGRLRRSRATTD